MTLARDTRRQPPPAAAILGAIMTPSPFLFVISLLILLPSAAGDARRHRLCSRAAFVTIM